MQQFYKIHGISFFMNAIIEIHIDAFWYYI